MGTQHQSGKSISSLEYLTDTLAVDHNHQQFRNITLIGTWNIQIPVCEQLVDVGSQ